MKRFNELTNEEKVEDTCVEQTVKENQQLIKDKVIDCIQSADYTDEALMKFESLAESFTSNIYDFVEIMRTKNGQK